MLEREMKPAVMRGLRRKCPACGAGPLMKSFLKTHDRCAVCGTELHHHRADDGPAYLTILIVGHLLAPVLLTVYSNFQPDPLTLGIALSLASIGLSLFLLPRLKGMIVAIQWAKRMHGFGAALDKGGSTP